MLYFDKKKNNPVGVSSLFSERLSPPGLCLTLRGKCVSHPHKRALGNPYEQPGVDGLGAEREREGKVRLGSCHKRQKPQAPTPQAPIRNRQTRKVANAKGLNRNTNLT